MPLTRSPNLGQKPSQKTLTNAANDEQMLAQQYLKDLSVIKRIAKMEGEERLFQAVNNWLTSISDVIHGILNFLV